MKKTFTRMRVMYETEYTSDGDFVLWLATGTEKQFTLTNPDKGQLMRADEVFELVPFTKWDEEAFNSYKRKVL